MTNQPTWGQLCKSARAELDLGIYETAKKLSISKSWLYRIETDQSLPNITVLLQFISFFGFDYDEAIAALERSCKTIPEARRASTSEAVTIGEVIREHREEKGMTQKAAAAEIGINPASWSNWEQGHHAPAPENAAKVEKLFDIEEPLLTGDLQ